MDDEPSVLHLLEIGLSRLNCELWSAGGGETALAMARELGPDLVILDIVMPGMDGYEVCRLLRAFSSTPVILLTALRDSADLMNTLAAGADEYVAKPFSVADLLGRSRNALARRKVFPANCKNPAPFAGGRFSFDVDRQLLYDMPRRRPQLPVVVPLSNTGYRLILYMACNRGRRLPYEELLERLWGVAWANEHELLQAHLSTLRRRLEADPIRPRLIVDDGEGGVTFLG